MKFERSPVIEMWLDLKGVDYEYRELDSDSINRQASRENHARLSGAIIDDHVLKLAEDNDTNAVFPPCIATKDKTGKKYRLLDGNHRDEANQLNGGTSLCAYVVETDDNATLDLITRFANRDLNGVGQSREEAMQHALYLQTTYGLSVNAAAKAAGVKVSTFRRHKANDEIRKELFSQRIDANKLSDGAVVQLGKLRANAAVMASAADTALRHGLGEKDAKWLADSVLRAKKTENDQLQAIERFEEANLKTTQSQAIVADAHVRAGRRLKQRMKNLLQHLEEFGTAEANAISDATGKELLCRDIDRIINRLRQLAKTAKE